METKALLFVGINKKYYDKLKTELKKRHDSKYIDSIMTHYKTKRYMFLYDEDCRLTETDFDIIAEHVRPGTAQAGIIMQGKSVSDVFFREEHLDLRNTVEMENWSQVRSTYLETKQPIDNRILIKRELTQRYFEQEFSDPSETEQKILDEVLGQIATCEDFLCGLNESIIKEWLHLANVTKVQMKAKTRIWQKLA